MFTKLISYNYIRTVQSSQPERGKNKNAFIFQYSYFFNLPKHKADLNVCVIKVEVKYKTASTVLRNGKSPETMRTTRPWTIKVFMFLLFTKTSLSTVYMPEGVSHFHNVFVFPSLSPRPRLAPSHSPHFLLSFRVSTWRFREQKYSRARRKRLHCRLGHFVHTEPLNIFALLRRKYM